MSDLGERLAARTLELVDIPSESGHEATIREHLLELVPSTLGVEAAGDEAFLLLPRFRADSPLVLLAGHYDTVPEQGNLPGRIEDGSVHGLGASDMKGGLAVALELVRDLAEIPAERFDVGLLLFGREELPRDQDPLPALFAASDVLPRVALAILLEPTDGKLQAGCLGNVVARLVFHGRSGHSARPWLADSAIAHAVHGLEQLLAHEPREALVGGLSFVEVVTVTRLEAGLADNVIPGEAVATVNLRYLPDRAPDEAEAYLTSLVPDGASLEVVGNAPPGRVATDSDLVAELRAAGGLELEAKQAWTNVADFTEHSVDAVNFGPGHTRYAHTRDERVEISALVHAYETLARFLGRPVREDPD